MPPDPPAYSRSKLLRLAEHCAQKSSFAAYSDALWTVKYAPTQHNLILGNEHNVEFLYRRLRCLKQAEATQKAKSKYYDDDLVHHGADFFRVYIWLVRFRRSEEGAFARRAAWRGQVDGCPCDRSGARL